MSTFTEALTKHLGRIAVGADLDSAEWKDKVAVGLRDRAFWTARNANVQLAQEMKDRVSKMLNPQQVRRADRVTPQNPEGFVTEGMNLATARAELKQMLTGMGYQPEAGKAGTIQDLGSDGRLNLVLRQNTDSAFGFGQFLQGQDPAALDQWPAQELFRAEERKEPRPWPTRWMQAGGQIFSGGRMIALKTDPIWSAISEFDTPYPPFDYNSGMWVRDVDRATAEELGLLAPGAEVKPSVEDFNARLEASVKNIDPELQAVLKESFGPQIEFKEGVARWTGVTPPPPAPPVRPPVVPPVVPPPVRPPVVPPPAVKPPVVPPTPPTVAKPAPVVPPAPVPVVKPKLVVPDLTGLAREYQREYSPVVKARLAERAREALTVPEPGKLDLTMDTRNAGTKAVAREGSSIVERYTAPELVNNTKVTVMHLRGNGRAHHRGGTVHINQQSGASTAAHEHMHAVEQQNPQVLLAAAEFLLQRGAGQAPQPLRKLTGIKGYAADEVALEDDWAKRRGSVYAGKVYSWKPAGHAPADLRATEVLTMGIERLHRDPLEFFNHDREWFEFVVKTLRAI